MVRIVGGGHLSHPWKHAFTTNPLPLLWAPNPFDPQKGDTVGAVLGDGEHLTTTRPRHCGEGPRVLQPHRPGHHSARTQIDSHHRGAGVAGHEQDVTGVRQGQSGGSPRYGYAPHGETPGQIHHHHGLAGEVAHEEAVVRRIGQQVLGLTPHDYASALGEGRRGD